MDDLTMTPARAEKLGERWGITAAVLLGLAVVFIAAELSNLAYLATLLSLVCARTATGHFAWRRGYLAANQEARSAGGWRG